MLRKDSFSALYSCYEALSLACFHPSCIHLYPSLDTGWRNNVAHSRQVSAMVGTCNGKRDLTVQWPRMQLLARSLSAPQLYTDRIREALFSPPNLAGTAAASGGCDSEGSPDYQGTMDIEPGTGTGASPLATLLQVPKSGLRGSFSDTTKIDHLTKSLSST
jgi:hypothetical protein